MTSPPRFVLEFPADWWLFDLGPGTRDVSIRNRVETQIRPAGVSHEEADRIVRTLTAVARAAHDQGALQAAGTFRWRPDGTYELAATVVHRVAVPEGMPGGVAALGPEGAPDPPDVAGHGASGFTLSERPGIGVVGRLAIVRDGARAGGEGEPAASLHIIAPIPDSPDFLVLSSFTSDAARSREFFELCDAIGATLRFGG